MKWRDKTEEEIYRPLGELSVEEIELLFEVDAPHMPQIQTNFALSRLISRMEKENADPTKIETAEILLDKLAHTREEEYDRLDWVYLQMVWDNDGDISSIPSFTAQDMREAGLTWWADWMEEQENKRKEGI